ncbi:penicillin-binding transpeptidase domain-containing protein [Clostridium estertheticum]|uniref:penicillin-binding transpeptidase domain-containing protein n=1 Tax=Clostridium estertheticum TaxID=238834 RepID=UPI001C6F5921|nr:penicillin-binding transpeptidase domain-containing protein [Clostridium estertheticum]MBW9152609.1 penicillin-binding transpeptidase domain-containing protein [Clostridium estertheticum]WLC85973.1 penicillin-binding transpeptidase domain-containing protein [Clostridium estertheticum]
MSRKYLKVSIFTILGIVLVVGGVFLFTIYTKVDSATKTFDTYKTMWVKQDFKAMYNMLSVKTKETITEKQFLNKYNAIYKGIEAKDIVIKVDNEEKIKDGNKKTIEIPFSIVMNTTAGQLKMPGYQATMIKEKVNKKKQWTIVWDEKMILPSMGVGDKIKVITLPAIRGEIYDKNKKPLAINAAIVTIGISFNDFVKEKDNNITQMAKILDIDASAIKDKLKANKNPDEFIPIINILSSEKVKIAEVMKIKGVIHMSPKGRIYPGGEAFGSLIGYIAPITGEELEKMSGQGYSSSSLIGKAGLEQVYEKRLKGESGATIYISRQKDGKEIKEDIILSKASKAGENITLSVDSALQANIYKGMNKEPGASAAINPKTGEVLALVSSPSYDSNAYTTYKSNTQIASWKVEKEPFKNRFKAVYSPGSTFKLITAAVGLDNAKIKPEELINIPGLKWQPDKSWGTNMVTRVSDKIESVNLKDAFVYSDNIYFARAALKIGTEEFIKGSNRFGIGEKLPIDYPIAISQVANNNVIKNDVALADTGYGQGEVLMSPLQIALAYSAVVNEGNIMSPTLENFNTLVISKVWKSSVISKNNIKALKDDLTEVIEDPNGTGHVAKISGVNLAGKTGTAELKKDAKDITAEENGWFVCMNTDNPKIVVSMIMENVKNTGGSHHVVPIVKGVMGNYLKTASK